jgi:hypothetical protein
MATYAISMPITGFIYKEVEADSEEQAKEKFHQLELKTDDIEDWEIHNHVTQGNMFYGMLNDVDIEEV